MFFAEIREKLNKAKTLESKLPDYVKSSLQKREFQLSQANRDQLNKGLDSDGKSLGSYRNFSYKNRFKPVDLNLSGDLHDSIKPDFAPGGFTMESNDWKRDMLEKKYGPEILGLSERAIHKEAKAIIPELQDKVKRALSL